MDRFGSWLEHFGKKALANVATRFTRDNLPGLLSNIASNTIDKFERKICEKGAQEKDSLYSFRMKISIILLKL